MSDQPNPFTDGSEIEITVADALAMVRMAIEAERHAQKHRLWQLECVVFHARWLLQLKDGPRDAEYQRLKVLAWRGLRESLALDGGERSTNG